MKLKDLINKFGEYEVPQELIDKFELLEKPKPKTIWNLKYNDLYNWIDGEGNIGTHHWCKDEIDLNLRKAGNVFLTYKEAAGEKERREVETLLLKYGGRRWYKENADDFDFVIKYSTPIKKLWVDRAGLAVQGAIYFDSIEKAEKAIQEIGEDRVVKALFEVR